MPTVKLINRNNGNVNKQEQRINIRGIDRLSGRDIIYRNSWRSMHLLCFACGAVNQNKWAKTNAAQNERKKWRRKSKENRKKNQRVLKLVSTWNCSMFSRGLRTNFHLTERTNAQSGQINCSFDCKNFHHFYQKKKNQTKHKNWLNTKYLTDVIHYTFTLAHKAEMKRRKTCANTYRTHVFMWVYVNNTKLSELIRTLKTWFACVIQNRIIAYSSPLCMRSSQYLSIYVCALHVYVYVCKCLHQGQGKYIANGIFMWFNCHSAPKPFAQFFKLRFTFSHCVFQIVYLMDGKSPFFLVVVSVVLLQEIKWICSNAFNTDPWIIGIHNE